MRKINVRDFTLANRLTAREVNRQILLNLVREHQPISRAELARKMRVGRGVVSVLATKLILEGAIYEGGRGKAARGRKPRYLYVRTHDRLAIAMDVRFSRTYIMLSDFAGKQVALESFKTMFSPSELVDELAVRVRRLIRAQRAQGRVEGIGVVVPGIVEARTGRVLNAPQLAWRDVDLRGPLEAATGLAVHVENAATACALGRMWLGERGERAPSDFVYVTVSDGVGAAAVINGQVLRGPRHTAGEFGHIPLHPEGPHCLCGARGCWEAYTSNLATLSRFLHIEPGPADAQRLLKEEDISIADVIARARTGDATAIAALEHTGHYLGVGISLIVKALAPAEIFVGGEITDAWDLIRDRVDAAIAERSLTGAAAATPVNPEPSGGHPRLRGATALVSAPVFAAPRVA
ncbi:MAG: ROK family protein [Longimicrobiales bacterium]